MKAVCDIAPMFQSMLRPASLDLEAQLYSPWWRIISGVLAGVSRASLPVLLVLGMLVGQPISLFVWLRTLGSFAVLPALAATLIARGLRAQVEVRGARLCAHRGDLTIEIPYAAIERVVPWVFPLPGPGFSLCMRSGRRLRYGVQATDPTRILSALVEIGGVEAARSALSHPSVCYAYQRSLVGWRWYHFLVKFPLFALIPTGVWFNAHQHIAYGGLLGQYYLEGLVPYLRTFGISWSLATIYLVLYASTLRAVAEGVALLAAFVAPARAPGMRHWVEVTCRVIYYGSVPAIMLVPFLL